MNAKVHERHEGQRSPFVSFVPEWLFAPTVPRGEREELLQAAGYVA